MSGNSYCYCWRDFYFIVLNHQDEGIGNGITIVTRVYSNVGQFLEFVTIHASYQA
jgi:hypothetical protein